MTAPEISVAIPTWNGLTMLEAHLPSVLREASAVESAEVVVCDDASTDGTAEAMARRFPAARVVPRPRNGGFAPAANEAVAASRGRLVLLLNNDVEVEPGAISSLACAVDADAAAFAAVPEMMRAGSGIDEAATRLRFRRGVVFSDLSGIPGESPAYACGGAMMFRRDDFLRLGGFDPLFAPFYWEDVDLSYRARKRGRRIVRVFGARVVHDHDRTIGARFARETVSRIYERNRLLFTWKNLTDAPLWRAHLALLPPKLAWDAIAHRAFVAGFREAWKRRREIAPLRELERAEAVRSDRDLLDRL